MKKNTQKGYSVIELIIYISLLALISVVLIQSLITVMKTYNTAISFRRMQNNGDLVMERITREIRNATSISSATYNTNPGSITFAGKDSNGNARTVSLSVSGGAVQINDNGTNGALSTSDVTVTSLIFRHITTPVGDGVKVEMTLTTTGGLVFTAPFYSTIMLRGK